MKANNYSKGKLGEDIAEAYLLEKGYDILSKNYKIKKAEIDIIAFKDKIITFVEVKSRTNRDFGLACEAVDKTKQNKIRLAAEYFLSKDYIQYEEVSFDVIEIYYENFDIIHIIDCF